MKCPKCLFCPTDAVFDFGFGNLICSACLEDKILRAVRLEPVTPGQHHPGVSEAATPSHGRPSLGVAVSSPSSDTIAGFHPYFAMWI